MGRITPAGVITEFDIPTPDSQPRATALDATATCGSASSPPEAPAATPQGVITEFPIPTPNSTRARGRRTATSGFPSSTRARSAAGAGRRGDGFIRRVPTAGRRHHGRRRRQMWFVELNGRMDDRVVDGNRVAASPSTAR
jgi:hypothetical protein